MLTSFVYFAFNLDELKDENDTTNSYEIGEHKKKPLCFPTLKKAKESGKSFIEKVAKTKADWREWPLQATYELVGDAWRVWPAMPRLRWGATG